jgi:hypothetical protein
MSSTAKAPDVPIVAELTEQQRELIKSRRQDVLRIIKESRKRYLLRADAERKSGEREDRASWLTRHLKRK